MATSIKLDKDCDIVFDESGICELVESTDDIIQAIRIELEQNKEQWALNTLYGVPYLNKQNTGILQVKNNHSRILQELIKTISKYEIDKIESIDFVNNEIVAKIQIKGEVYTL